MSEISRFRKSSPCPICRGYDDDQRGNGQRCFGFLSTDGLYAHCTREEYAGGLPQEDNAQTYAHKLEGDCKCGTRHGYDPPHTSSNGTGKMRIETTYQYRDKDGMPLFEVVKFRCQDGSKTYRPRHCNNQGGIVWGMKGVPRVIYRLPEVRKALAKGWVLCIAEGEKCCDAIGKKAGHVATTNIGGAGKWTDADSQALIGAKHVVIFPDNDDPGRRHAEQMRASLRRVGVVARIARLEGLPPKGDIADWLETHTGEEFYQLVTDTFNYAKNDEPDPFVSFVSSSLEESENFPEPRALPDPLPAVEGFEPLLLPEAFRPWVMDIAERMQCPPDYPSVAAMIGLAAVVGRRVGIRPKRHDNWTVVGNLWGSVIGRSGVLKTPAIQEPLKPLLRLEFDEGRNYEAAVKGWKADQAVKHEQEKVTQTKIRKALEQGEHGAARGLALRLQEEEEGEPVRKRYLVNDTTVEKLGELLNQNPNGLLVFRDELVGFLRTLDREGHEGDRAFYLEAWNGTGRFTYDRISRGTIDIEAATVSVLGGIQPGPLAQYLRSALAGGVGDDGLLQRFQLSVYPDISGEFRNVDRWPDTQAKNRAYAVWEQISKLTAADVDARIDETDDTIPFLQFTPEAQEAFDEWRLGLERRLRSGDDHAALESHFAKYRSLLPSLALLIHLADVGHGPIGVDAFGRAAAWAEYLESHARRVYSHGLHDMAARELAKHLLRNDLPETFTIRDVYRHCWAALDTKEEATKAADALVEYGWILVGEALATGGRPTMQYRVNPRIAEEGRL
jgi:hypothetical protein